MASNKSFNNIDTSLDLYGHDAILMNFIKLFENGNFPKISLISGDKGIGKFTLVYHFIIYIFSKRYKEPYNLDKKSIGDTNLILNKINSKTFQNFIYFPNEIKNKLSIEKVREIKKELYNSTLDNNPRFIIFDDVEFLNTNVVNSLLKMIEEPGKNNYFILINNKRNNLIETLKSRSIETKIFLNPEQKNFILKKILNNHDIDDNFIFNYSHLSSPGMFIKYYYILTEINAELSTSLYELTSKLLEKYKKDKQEIYIDCIKFFLEIKFNNNNFFQNQNIISLIKFKNDIFKILYDYKRFNLTNNSVLNIVKNSII
ncbi:MAG: hypothetical protein CBD56_00375 [Candidatus Pelagibacter sp. TMED196]|nr:MAG: hypothetical protein CBD56_00375 [Candidatus Pelagibacter sp. TMED196]|tara:strand:+ start:1064 stop:2008 length:945 start_codon:yes stop_codon:yes gene_type:complete